MPKIDPLVLATIIGPLLGGILGAAIVVWLERRPKLISWLVHASAVRMPPPQGQTQPVYIHTHAVVIRNAGRRSANNVRLGHYHLPDFSVFPGVAYRVENLLGGGEEIIFPTLVPNEQVTINYLYFPPNTYDKINSYTKSDEGLARTITVLPTPLPPPWQYRIASVVFLIGIVTTLYLLALMALWLIRVLR